LSLNPRYRQRQGKPHRADVNQRTGFWLRIKSNINCDADLNQLQWMIFVAFDLRRALRLAASKFSGR
jgi:hypothetical protein